MNNQEQEQKMVGAVLDTLKGVTDISSETIKIYQELISDLSKERKGLLITLGSISAGAAALAPQFFGHVIHTHYFYAGISLLAFTVVMSLSYILGLIENDSQAAVKNRDLHINMIDKMRKPKVDFVNSTDHSQQNFILTHNLYLAAFKDYGDSLQKNKLEAIKQSKYKHFPAIIKLDYAGEYMVWFFVTGIGLITLSTLSRIPSICVLILIIVVTFVLINITMSVPDKIFVWLGFPMDYIKSLIAKQSK